MKVPNSLGRLIFLDEATLLVADKKMAWALVEMDTSERLPETLKISWGDKVMSQPLDYWKVPFTSLNYRRVSDLINSCVTPSRQGYGINYLGLVMPHAQSGFQKRRQPQAAPVKYNQTHPSEVVSYIPSQKPSELQNKTGVGVLSQSVDQTLTMVDWPCVGVSVEGDIAKSA